MEEVRVRFAPSPTGYLHIGGARTALYNWLYAKKHDGVFILRIEDTDETRSTEEAIGAIEDSLKWLGLDWDEGPGIGGESGPYRQSQRGGRYSLALRELLRTDRAYHCYCLPDELKDQRARQRSEGRPPRYDRTCLDLSDEQIRSFTEVGRQPTVRFLTTDSGKTVIKDLVRGDVSFDNSTFGDFILARSDGTPTYNLAVVVDDHEMGVSHVLRGEDHLSNTPKQLLLFESLGWDPPTYGHLPMIVGDDRTPLSKRHGAVAIGEFRAGGYLPETILNFLALLGWSFDDAQVLFERDELVEKFSLDRVIKSAALFDREKLDWMNGTYIRKMAVPDLARRIRGYLSGRGLVEDPSLFEESWWNRLAEIVQERAATLTEVAELSGFLFDKTLSYDSKAEKVLKKEGAGKILEEVLARLEGVQDFTAANIEGVLRGLQEETGLKARKVFQPIRAAVTGRMVSPPLFESIELLGKQKTAAYLRLSVTKALAG